MSNFLDRFLPDPDFPDSRWIWSTEKPLLQDAKVAFAPYDPSFHLAEIGKATYLLDPSCRTARIADDKVAVVIFERNESAAIIQENGWNYMLANAPAIEERLLRKLASVHAKSLEQFLEEEMPGYPPYEKLWEQIKNEIESPENAVTQFFKLIGISLATTGLDECCFVAFEFQSAWDQDHGLEIMMHKDQVLAAAGLTELMSPRGSMVEKIKAIQAEDQDAIDFLIP